MRKTTVGELQSQLPVGVVVGNKLVKEFSLRPYRASIDRHMGAWEETAAQKYTPGVLLAHRVPKFLSLLVGEIGGKSVPLQENGDSSPEQELKFHKLHYADAMYLYLLARISAVGADYRLPFRCPACKTEGTATFDLKQVQVTVLETPAELEATVKLKHPIKLRTGKTARQVKLRPPSWTIMTKPGVVGASVGQVGYSYLVEAICGADCEEGPYEFMPDEVDALSKIDTIMLDRHAPAAGPDLEAKINCPKDACKAEIVNGVNWTFAHFFGWSVPDSVTSPA